VDGESYGSSCAGWILAVRLLDGVANRPLEDFRGVV
jgi:hypothetical protein